VKEVLKILLPFVLGFLSAPILEIIKERIRQNRLKKMILTSLNDEFDFLEDCITTTAQSITLRKSDNLPFLKLGREIDFTLLSNFFYDVYESLSKEQRKAYSALLTHQKTITEKYNKVRENYKTDNKLCLIAECSMLNSMLVIYYILNDIIDKKERYVFPTLPTYEIAGRAAEATGVYEVYSYYLSKVK